MIEIRYPTGTAPVPTTFTSEGIVSWPPPEQEIQGLIADTATGKIWLGIPLTQMVAHDPGSSDPDWYIDFPEDPISDPLPADTDLVEAVFITDGSDLASVVFRTEGPSAQPMKAAPAAEMAAKGTTPSWDAIRITSVTKPHPGQVQVSGQTPGWKKAKVLVVLVGKTNQPAAKPGGGPTRHVRVKKDKAANSAWSLQFTGVPNDTYVVIAMVRSGRKVDVTTVTVP
ncbi:MAG TPA: hypothetical protein VNK04_24165 [Gemmataceae bacterium]|nr:hypothetical protein [Gemmataceae bacterium]